MRFVLLFVLLAACSGERDPSQYPLKPSELAPQAGSPGERTYRRYCIGCHGADGRGNGGKTGQDFTLAGGPLSVKSDDELIASVRDGKRGVTATMPAHSPVLKPEEIRAVVGYVKQTFAPH